MQASSTSLSATQSHMGHVCTTSCLQSQLPAGCGFSPFFALSPSFPCNLASSKSLVKKPLCQNLRSTSQQITVSRSMILILLLEMAATGRKFTHFRCHTHHAGYLWMQRILAENKGLFWPLLRVWSVIPAGNV